MLELEKAKKDLAKLTQKTVTDKLGHQRKVWVKVGEDAGKKKNFLLDKPKKADNHIIENNDGSVHIDVLDPDTEKVKFKEGQTITFKVKGQSVVGKVGKEIEDGVHNVEIRKGFDMSVLSLIFNNDIYKAITEKLPTDDTLQKGFFDEMEVITLEKKGKEIKEKISQLINEMITLKTIHYENLVAALKCCNIQPIENAQHWNIRGFERRIGVIPKVFSYEQLDNLRAVSGDGSHPTPRKYDCEDCFADHSSTTPNGSQSQYCYNYNECVYMYLNCCVELCKMQTLCDNLADNATLNLSITQAAILGF